MPTFDITGEPVGDLGVGVDAAGLYDRSRFLYDYAIDGLPFLSAASDKTPYQRGLAEQRKQQVDTSAEPGEQSLDGWWMRSQASLLGGGGIKYLEPVSDEFTARRFTTSVGVDVWSDGEWSLLNDVTVESTVPSGYNSMCVVSTGSSDTIFCNDDDNVYKNGVAMSGWSASPRSVLTAGGTVLVCHTTGIDKCVAPYTSPAPLWTGAGVTPSAWWVKQRIIATQAHRLYEMGLTGGAWPSAFYTHPDTNWTWSSVCGTGTSILAAGYSGSSSAIYRFDLDTAGALPTLTGAITAAELPGGETVRAMFAYLGVVVIGTNKGVRVAQVSADGSLTYGPLSYESDYSIDDFAGTDRFVFFAVWDSEQLHDSDDVPGPGLVRLDLSSDDGAGRYAWANDLRTTGNGVPVGLAVGHDGAKIFGALQDSEFNAYREDLGNLVAAGGELTTGLVRFGTLEPKMFRDARVRGDIPDGTVNLFTFDGTNRVLVSTFTDASGIGGAVTLPDVEPQEALGLTIRLGRGSAEVGPTISGWQLRALPAVERKQVLVIPLYCFDVESDKAGVRRGGRGQAMERFTALLDAVDNGRVVILQDFNTGEELSVQVEDVQFTQVAAPATGEGFGGVIQLRARTV